MAQIVQVNDEWKINLKVNKSFIEKYGLENKILIPDIEFLFHNHCYDMENNMEIPYSFSLFNENLNKDYLEFFLQQFKSMSSDIQDEHVDELLFLAYSFNLENLNKANNINKDKWLRGRAKLLIDLIKVPIPVITKENIYDYVEDDDELSTYLSVVTGKKISHFFTKDKTIDWKKINPELWTMLNKKIQADKNISVPLKNENILTISKDINLEFSYKRKNKKVAITIAEKNQSISLTKVILSKLIDEQEKHETIFYEALTQHDFITNSHYKLLIDAAGLFTKTYHIWLLNRLSELLKKYLTNEGLFSTSSKRRQSNFIYQYFLMLGLLPNGYKKLLWYAEKGSLLKAIEDFKSKTKDNPSWSTVYFKDSFKNLKRYKSTTPIK